MIPIAFDLQSGKEVRKRRPFSSVGSRQVHNEKKFRATAQESDNSDYEEEDVYLMKKESDFYPIKGHPGMWYKVRGFLSIKEIDKLFNTL